MRLLLLRLRNCLYKYRLLLIIAVLALIAFILYSKVSFPTRGDDIKTSLQKYVGIIGTLLGAIVGGVFTLLGTVWVQKRQARIQNDIRRSNTIYKPLYDELKHIHDEILIENQYPQSIVFGNANPYEHGINYEVWIRIKSDSRYLETPEPLRQHRTENE